MSLELGYIKRKEKGDKKQGWDPEGIYYYW